MKRIIASYVEEEDYNDIGDREIALDDYAEIEVKTIKEGVEVIARKELNGCGYIDEQREDDFGNWETFRTHFVDNGIVYRVEDID